MGSQETPHLNLRLRCFISALRSVDERINLAVDSRISDFCHFGMCVRSSCFANLKNIGVLLSVVRRYKPLSLHLSGAERLRYYIPSAVPIRLQLPLGLA
jgi:hypothetical protein